MHGRFVPNHIHADYIFKLFEFYGLKVVHGYDVAVPKLVRDQTLTPKRVFYSGIDYYRIEEPLYNFMRYCFLSALRTRNVPIFASQAVGYLYAYLRKNPFIL